MSGRKSRKSQKLGSSRRSVNRGHNRDSEEKESNDGSSKSGCEEQKNEQQKDPQPISENQPTDASLLLQSGQAETASISQQMSASELHIHSQDGKDLLAQAEAVSKKRRIGSARKRVGFKGREMLEEEPEHNIGACEGISEEQVTDEVSVIEERGRADNDQQVLYVHASCQSTQLESSTLDSEPIGISSHEPDQHKGASFCEESTSHSFNQSMDIHTENKLSSHETSASSMCHQTEALHNTIGLTNRKGSDDRANENCENTEREIACPSEGFSEVLNECWTMDPDEKGRTSISDVHDYSKDGESVSSITSQDNENRECTFSAQGFTAEPKGGGAEGPSQSFTNENEKENSDLLRDGGEEIEEDISDHLKHNNETSAEDFESIHEFKSSKYREGQGEFEEEHLGGERTECEDVAEVKYPVQTVEPNENIPFPTEHGNLEDLSCELDVPCDSSSNEIKHHPDARPSKGDSSVDGSPERAEMSFKGCDDEEKKESGTKIDTMASSEELLFSEIGSTDNSLYLVTEKKIIHTETRCEVESEEVDIKNQLYSLTQRDSGELSTELDTCANPHSDSIELPESKHFEETRFSDEMPFQFNDEERGGNTAENRNQNNFEDNKASEITSNTSALPFREENRDCVADSEETVGLTKIRVDVLVKTDMSTENRTLLVFDSLDSVSNDNVYTADVLTTDQIVESDETKELYLAEQLQTRTACNEVNEEDTRYQDLQEDNTLVNEDETLKDNADQTGQENRTGSQTYNSEPQEYTIPHLSEELFKEMDCLDVTTSLVMNSTPKLTEVESRSSTCFPQEKSLDSWLEAEAERNVATMDISKEEDDETVTTFSVCKENENKGQELNTTAECDVLDSEVMEINGKISRETDPVPESWDVTEHQIDVEVLKDQNHPETKRKPQDNSEISSLELYAQNQTRFQGEHRVDSEGEDRKCEDKEATEENDDNNEKENIHQAVTSNLLADSQSDVSEVSDSTTDPHCYEKTIETKEAKGYYGGIDTLPVMMSNATVHPTVEVDLDEEAERLVQVEQHGTSVLEEKKTDYSAATNEQIFPPITPETQNVAPMLHDSSQEMSKMVEEFEMENTENENPNQTHEKHQPSHEKDESRGERDNEQRNGEENDLYPTARTSTSCSTSAENCFANESIEAREIIASPREESNTEDFIEVCSEQYVLFQSSSPAVELSLTTNTQSPAVSELSDPKEDDENGHENVEMRSTELHPQRESKKKRRFGSTRRPQGGHKQDNGGEEGRKWKETDAEKEIKHKEEESCSIETTHQEITTDLHTELQSEESRPSLGILDPLLEKEGIVSTDKAGECGTIDTPHVTLTDVPNTDHETCIVEDLAENDEVHGKSVQEDEKKNEKTDDTTPSEGQKIPTVITAFQNDASTVHNSSQEMSIIVEEGQKENTENAPGLIPNSLISGTTELFPETQDRVDIPLDAENSHEVISDQLKTLPWDHNIPEEKPAVRESESTDLPIEIQESDTTKNSELSTSEKRRKIGSTRRSHRERLHGSDNKNIHDKEENGDEKEESDLYLGSNISDTNIEVIVEESKEPKEETSDQDERCSKETTDQEVSTDMLTEHQSDVSELGSPLEKEIVESTHEPGESGMIDLPSVTPTDIIVHSIDHEVSSADGHVDYIEGHEKTGLDKKMDDSPSFNEQKMQQISTEMNNDDSTVYDSSQEISVMDEECEKENTVNGSPNQTHTLLSSGTMDLIPMTHDSVEISVNPGNCYEVTSDHTKEVHWDHTVTEDPQGKTTDRESESTASLIHTQESSPTEDNVTTENSELSTGKRRKIGSTRRKQRVKLHGGDNKKIHEKEENRDENDEEGRYEEENNVYPTEQSTTPDTRMELIEEEPKELKEETIVPPREESTTEDFIAVCSEQYVLSELSSQTVDLSLTTNTQSPAVSEPSGFKDDDENGHGNVESTELHPQSESKKKRRFGSTRRPQGGHKQDDDGEEGRKWKEIDAAEEIKHKEEESCSTESTHQKVTTDLNSESQSDESRPSLGILDPLLEKEGIVSTDKAGECGTIDTPHVTLTDVPNTDHEICIVEDLAENDEVHGKSVQENEKKNEKSDDTTPSDEQKIPTVITAFQNDASTVHNSSQEMSNIVEEGQKENTENAPGLIHNSLISGTTELFPETQVRVDIPLDAENSHEVISDQLKTLPWDHNIPEEKPAVRESESTDLPIEIQESDTTKNSVLSTSEKRRKIGSTRRSHRERFHGSDNKNIHDKEENGDEKEESDLYLGSNISDTNIEVIVEESKEPKEETSDQEERCSKETTDQEVSTDMLTEHQSDVSELGSPLEKEIVESTHEPGESGMIDLPSVTPTDIIVHSIDHEVSSADGHVDYIEGHEKTGLDKKMDDSPSFNEQKMQQISTEMNNDDSTVYDSSQEISVMVEECEKENTVNGSPNQIHTLLSSGTMDLIPMTHDSVEISVNPGNSHEVTSDHTKEVHWDQTVTEDHQGKTTDRESESTASLIHTQESSPTEDNVTTENLELSTGKRRKIGSTRRKQRVKLHGGDNKKIHEKEENRDENDEEGRYEEENNVYPTEQCTTPDTKMELIEEEPKELKEETIVPPREESTTEDFIAVCSEQYVLSELSSQTVDLSLTTNTQSPAVSEPSGFKDDDENGHENVESTELHPQSESKKKRRFGSTRRPQGGHKQDDDGEEERKWKETDAAEEIKHKDEESCSTESTHREVTTDLHTESQSDESRPSLGILDPLLEKEGIVSTDKAGECGMIETPHVTLTDVPNTDHEICIVEDLAENDEVHGKSVQEDEKKNEKTDDTTPSDEQKIPTVITAFQNDASTVHNSSQEMSIIVEEGQKENTENAPGLIHNSLISGTTELFPETQVRVDIPLDAENSHEVISDQLKTLPWDHNIPEEKPAERESESTDLPIEIQESDTTKNSVLSTSEKRRKIGSTRRSHRERFRGDNKNIHEKEEHGDKEKGKYEEENNVYLTEQSTTPDTKVEFVEEEPKELQEETIVPPREESTTEDFIAECSEQYVLSELSSQTVHLSLTTNTQSSAVSEPSGFKEDDRKKCENIEMRSTELHLQSENKKKKRFGSTRRPQGGHRLDNDGEERKWRDPDATEDFEHVSIETTREEVTVDFQIIESTSETRESGMIDNPYVASTDIPVHSIDHEASNTEGQEENTEVHSEFILKHEMMGHSSAEGATTHIHIEESKTIQDNVIAENSELNMSGKRRKMGSTRRNHREHCLRDNQKDSNEDLQENETSKEQKPQENTIVTEKVPSEAEALSFIPAFNAETSNQLIDEHSHCESVSFKSQETKQLDIKIRKMGSTRKNFKGGESKKTWDRRGNMDPSANEDFATEEAKSTSERDTVLHDTVYGWGMIAEPMKQDNEPQVCHHSNILDQSESSLLSEIESQLKLDCQLSTTTPVIGEQISETSLNKQLGTSSNQSNTLDIPEPPAEQNKSSLELPPSQSSQTHSELSSPGRRRKMGSTRKTPRNTNTEELQSESLETGNQAGNLDKIELERKTEEAKDTLLSESVDTTSKPQADSQVNDSSRASPEPPIPEGKRKFGSRRTAKGSGNLGGLPPDEFETNQEREGVQVLADELTVCDPYFTSGPESTQISDHDAEPSPGNKHTEKSALNEADVPSETGLVSLDDLRKSAFYNGIAGKRERIDFETWNEQIPDFGVVVYNVVMVGNCSVGKTSFMNRFQSGRFSPDYSSTIGVDTCVQTITLGGRTVKLHVWDTAGQERYHSITRQVFHKAQGLLLMYDITSSESFYAVRKWISQIKERAPDDVIIMLLGNKNDCTERQVQLQDGECLSREYKIHFMECSAATGQNVAESMKTLACLLVKQNVRREEDQAILQPKQPQKKSGCC